MSTLIALETEDFARAARSVYSDVADPLTAAMARITARLDDCAAMAGTDPGGRHWAGAYDRSAAATLMATQDVLNGCYRLSALFAQTARNYEAAELASTAGGHHSGAAVTIQLPDETVVSLVTSLPTAAAGAAPPPGAWGLIANLMGRVWPNGHQDRLRAAARAWRSSGDDLWLRSEYVAVAVVPALGDHLPELPDMSTVCDAMYMHLRDVAAAHRALADACAQLAGHLDEMHAAVENELISLVEWTAGVEFTGALLSVVTLGAAEAPTQAVEGARIARTAARVGAIIDRFVALAGTAAATAGAVLDRVAVVSARVRALLNVQLSAATVTWAERLRTVHISGELGAIGRLSGDAERPTLRNIDNPNLFDPHVLEGCPIGEIREAIPSDWRAYPSRRGGGEVFEDPVNRGRQIRLMPGYPTGSRPDAITTGPYAVVSQRGGIPVKIALYGNPTLR